MKFETKYRICLHKNYFERGYGITSYFKYFIAFFGLAGGGVENTLIIGAIYVPFCYWLGRWWFRDGWVLAETEVSNKYNKFVYEMRRDSKKATNIKQASK